MEHISSIQGSVTLDKSNSLVPMTDLRPSKVQRALRGASFPLASPQPFPLFLWRISCFIKKNNDESFISNGKD